MSSTHRPWITGPALETVLALRPLKVGDEVKLKPCNERCAEDPNYESTLSGGTHIYHAGHMAKDFMTRDLVLVIEDYIVYRLDSGPLLRMARYQGTAKSKFSSHSKYLGWCMGCWGVVIAPSNVRALRFGP
jgi:hypothetical protein